MVIDENGVHLGEMDTNAALRRAQELGLDLVEVNPNARPPVCKIMDYGKFKYQQRKNKPKGPGPENKLKEVRLRPATDEHDLGIKVNNARRFLEEGHKVQFNMRFRGRERAHTDLAIQHMREIASQLADVGKVEREPRRLDRQAVMVILPLKVPVKKEGKPEKAEKPHTAAPKAADSKQHASEHPQSPNQPLGESLRIPPPPADMV